MRDAEMKDPLTGETIRFVPAEANTGVVTVRSRRRVVTVKRNGAPVKAGDIRPGEVVRVNKVTGGIEPEAEKER